MVIKRCDEALWRLKRQTDIERQYLRTPIGLCALYWNILFHFASFIFSLTHKKIKSVRDTLSWLSHNKYPFYQLQYILLQQNINTHSLVRNSVEPLCKSLLCMWHFAHLLMNEVFHVPECDTINIWFDIIRQSAEQIITVWM